MEIVYSIFIGMISSKIVGMIVGIGLQCRRDRSEHVIIVASGRQLSTLTRKQEKCTQYVLQRIFASK
jgi:tartrate dehydratase alpha subunit/fumarate hydratase class I-like protein